MKTKEEIIEMMQTALANSTFDANADWTTPEERTQSMLDVVMLTQAIALMQGVKVFQP